MNKNIVEDINAAIAKHLFFEIRILSINNSCLTLIGSEDFLYYHTLSISFADVHTIIIGTNFSVNTSKAVILLIDNTEEAYLLNLKYNVTIGNSVFKIISEDDATFYVIAEKISFSEEIIKYH